MRTKVRGYRLAEWLGSAAAGNGVMLMPSVGWDVVSTDRLAAQATSPFTDPVYGRIALKVAGGLSCGSSFSASAIVSEGAAFSTKLVSRNYNKCPRRSSASGDEQEGRRVDKRPRTCLSVDAPSPLQLPHGDASSSQQPSRGR
jgi:hypothetical protein